MCTVTQCLNFNCLITYAAQHLFLSLFATSVSSLVKFLFRSNPVFRNQFSILGVFEFLVISDSSRLSDVVFEHLSLSLAYCLIIWKMSVTEWKFWFSFDGAGTVVAVMKSQNLCSLNINLFLQSLEIPDKIVGRFFFPPWGLSRIENGHHPFTLLMVFHLSTHTQASPCKMSADWVRAQSKISLNVLISKIIAFTYWRSWL